MKLAQVIIDDEFRDRLPPLTADESNALRDNIVADGVITDPIIVWKEESICVDGHQRLGIYDKLVAEGIKISEPQIKTMSFANRESALAWMDAHARGQRNLTEKWRQIVIGRQYNATKQDDWSRHSVGGQADHLPKTSESIAKQEGIGEKTVRRYAAKAQVYEAVKNEYGRESQEARTVLTAPQPIIDKIVSGKNGVDAAKAITTIEKEVKARKKAKKHSGNNANGKLYSDAKTSIQKYVDKAKHLGRVPAAEFWAAIGQVSQQRWFRNLIDELHYMHIEEYDDGTTELVINEDERELCTAIHKQLERMREISCKWNQFKFDPALYKKTLQELFNLVSKASTHK